MRKATPYLLLAPALLFTAFILVYPLVQNVLNSLHVVTLAGGIGQWAGLANFSRVLQDGLFWLSFRNTVVYALMGTLLSLGAGLGFALLLNARTGRMSDLMGFLYAVPWVVSPVVAGFVWKWLLNDSFGILNEWLTRLSPSARS